MQYGHLSIGDRRDSGLESNGSTTFQSHVPSLNQALGHLQPGYPSRNPHTHDYRVSPSPSPIHPQQNGQPSQQQPNMSFPPAHVKRKHPVDTVIAQSNHKRRRDADDPDGFDEASGQGAKHWSDEEKSKLFKWLMGPGEDEHWHALRATKNSCLRECAMEVFHGKKTYQALKGCYERNFNLFKQIYSFESFHGQHGTLGLNSNLSEADTLREYERRLQSARKGGCDVGNITARTIDNWHRNGWYELFYQRWHGDPATTRPSMTRIVGHQPVNGNGGGANDDTDDNDDHGIEFAETITPNGSALSHERPSMPVTFVNPQSIQRATQMANSPHINGHPVPTPHQGLNGSASHTSPTLSSSTTSPSSSSLTATLLNPTSSSLPSSASLLASTLNPASLANPTSSPASASLPSSSSLAASLSSTAATSSLQSNATTSSSPPAGSSDQAVVNVTLTQGMITSYLQFLQVQTQTGKMKLEYLRKREEREERESHQRRELEKLRLERERAEFDHKQNSANTKQKADRAIELLSNPNVDASVKQVASDFLKRLFASD